MEACSKQLTNRQVRLHLIVCLLLGLLEGCASPVGSESVELSVEETSTDREVREDEMLPNAGMEIRRNLLPNETMDYGVLNASAINNGKPIFLPLKNNASDVIRILEVERSCGCLQADVSTSEIPPQQSATLRFHLSTLTPGDHKGTITLHCIDSRGAKWIEQLHVVWSVRSLANITPDFARIEDRAPGERFAVKFQFALNFEQTPSQPLRVVCDPVRLREIEGSLDLNEETKEILVEGIVPTDADEVMIPIHLMEASQVLAKTSLSIRPWRHLQFSPREVIFRRDPEIADLRRLCIVTLAQPASEVAFRYLPDAPTCSAMVDVAILRQTDRVYTLELKMRADADVESCRTGRLVVLINEEEKGHVPVTIR